MSEVHRFHAAGHVSAANIAMGAITDWLALPNVQAPPQVKDKVKTIRADLELLEGWLVDPFNTTLEKSGG